MSSISTAYTLSCEVVTHLSTQLGEKFMGAKILSLSLFKSRVKTETEKETEPDTREYTES